MSDLHPGLKHEQPEYAAGYEQGRADERERCIANAGERKLIHILNEGPARSDEINWFNAGVDTVIEAIKAE